MTALALIGRLDELIAARVDQLRHRCGVAREAVEAMLPDWELGPVDGGLVLWARLPGPWATRFIHHAARCGVLVAGADAFAVSPTDDDRIRIPFTADPDHLVEAARRPAGAWDSLDQSEPAPAGDRISVI